MTGIVVFLPPKPTKEDVGRALVRIGQATKPREKPHVILSGGSFPDWARDVVTEMGGKVTSVAPPKCDIEGNWSIPDELGPCEAWPGQPDPKLPCQPTLIVHPDQPETSWEMQSHSHGIQHRELRPHITSRTSNPCCELILRRLNGAAGRYLENLDGGPLPECADKLQNVWVVWSGPIPHSGSYPDCSVEDTWKRFELRLGRAKARGVNVVVELHRRSR